MKANTIDDIEMKAEYDLSKFKSHKNPYAKRLKKQITIGLHKEVIDYFKELSKETNIPYQNIIDMYLVDCARKHLKPNISWK